MPAFDSIFQYSPNTPAQVFMPATLGSASAPLLLVGTCGAPSLWINVGVVGTLSINGEGFTDNGWTLLAQIYDMSAASSATPLTNGNAIYQTLTDPTLSAVIAKLAIPDPRGGSFNRSSQAFYRMFTL